MEDNPKILTIKGKYRYGTGKHICRVFWDYYSVYNFSLGIHYGLVLEIPHP
jgi:hypothetical protein